MSISRFIRVLIFIFIILSAANIVVMFFSLTANSRLANAVDERHQYTEAINDVRMAISDLTRLARVHVVTGREEHLQMYYNEIENVDRFGRAEETFIRLNANQSEINTLNDIIRNSQQARRIEAQAFEMRNEGRYQEGIDILFNAEYIATMQPIGRSAVELYEKVVYRVENDLNQIRGEALFYEHVSFVLSVLPAVVGVWGIVVLMRKINPIHELTKLVKNVSRGNVDFNIDRRNIPNDEIGELIRDTCELIDVIRRMTDDLNKVSYAFVVDGDFEYRADSSEYENSFRELIESVNGILQNICDDNLPVIGIINGIAQGDFNATFPELPGKKINLTHAIRSIITNLRTFYESLEYMTKNTIEGNLDIKLDTARFSGNWAFLAERLNDLLGAVSEPIAAVEKSLIQMSDGNFEDAAIRAGKNEFKGTFANLKRALDLTRNTTLLYIDEIANILSAMSEGDLRVSISRDYTGSYAPIKSALNTILTSQNSIMAEIQSATSQLLIGAEQISNSSMFLAEGSSRQAHAIEELTESIERINEKIDISSETATAANKKAQSSANLALMGSEVVMGMVNTMDSVRESSAGISKIIKVIEEIAFQTNLLALNAAVEAARAGEHGRSFSIVADEVRSLAGKSQESAKETTEIIEKDTNAVESGIIAAAEVAKSFSSVIEDVRQISDLISKIANMAQEQAESISKINTSVAEIAKVVQENSSTAEESASSSQQLNSQAEMLKQLVSFFRLRR
ncbi:MAG: methyl-accepting chemotaxis protein [Defluviitaleaceae bacterium]|nr:methyl-accepting chemotaxis protein [Defluviitaleaceae bacterium]